VYCRPPKLSQPPFGLAPSAPLALAEENSGIKLSSLAQIDAILRTATDAKEVPGVVAMAATDNGILYEGVFGTRDLAKGPAMTRDTVFRIASMTKADDKLERGRFVRYATGKTCLGPLLSVRQITSQEESKPTRAIAGRVPKVCIISLRSAITMRAGIRRSSMFSSYPGDPPCGPRSFQRLSICST
jgi:Beta-lactamase